MSVSGFFVGLGKILLALLLLGMTAWSVLAVHHQWPMGWSRWLLAFMAFLTLAAALSGLWRSHYLWMLPHACLMGAVLIWWQALTPSLTRDWAPEVSRTTHGVVHGDEVRLHNVRNFTWRTPSDYDVRWETRRYDLSRLESVDLFLSYWMGPAIAHTLVSFGFSDGQRVVFSVEIRKEAKESFSTVGGFFKQFEMALVAADENDIIRTRTNARREDVYLYSIKMSRPRMRELFLAYVEQANELQREARFYNTLTANCTTIVYDMVRQLVPGLPWDIRIILSGYLPGYIHARHALAEGHTLQELRQAGAITQRALSQQAGQDYSTLIRQGVLQVRD